MAAGPGTLALCVKQLVKRYDDVVAVAGVDLEVHRGECFGLLGPNGAGKTTTVEMIEGLTAPDEGSIEVLGRPWSPRNDSWIRQRIGVQLQETQLAERLTVQETLRLFRSLYPEGRDIEEVISALELGEKRRAQVGKLSGGQRQRLALGCALVSDPEILFLDEPTTGLDPQARHKTWEIVEAFLSRGKTVLLTTHYMEEAATLCHRVAIMDRGRIIAIGTPADLIAGLGAPELVELEADHPLDEGRLSALAEVRSARRKNGRWVLSVSSAGRALPAVLAELEAQRASPVSLRTHHATLEDVFIQLTGRSLRDE